MNHILNIYEQDSSYMYMCDVYAWEKMNNYVE